MGRVDRVQRKLTLASSLLRAGNLREITKILRDKSWSNLPCLGLRRDLTTPFTAPAAAIPLTIRPLREDDIPHLMGVDGPELSGAGRLERINRLSMVRAGFSRCFVAANADDRPCYMQFLITSEENDLLRTHFRGLYPVLGPDESLLEGAFTPEAFRGQKIMPSAMAQIAAKAAEHGARRVITYVGPENIPSLKGCKRSGFAPFQERQERWRLFRQRVSFTSLPTGTGYSFDVPASPPTQPAAE